MYEYFSIFIPGLGEVVESELTGTLYKVGVNLLEDGFVWYQSGSAPEQVRKQFFLNNTFLLLDLSNGLGSDLLEKMAKNILQKSDKYFDSHYSQLENYRGKRFRFVFFLENKLTKVDERLLSALEERFEKKFGLKVDRVNPEIELWFLARRGGNIFFGLRITYHPDYKTVLKKGQLCPELAHLLCTISDPTPGDVVLDPFAGSGAIPLERKWSPYKQIIAGDCDSKLVDRLRKKAGKQIIVKKLDATDLQDITSGSVDKIITDPPWGVSISKELNLEDFYYRMLREFSRVLAPNGLLVILVGKKNVFESVLIKYVLNFQLLKRYNILVSGKKAAIFKIKIRT